MELIIEKGKDIKEALAYLYNFHDNGYIKTFEITARRDYGNATPAASYGFDGRIIIHCHKWKNGEGGIKSISYTDELISAIFCFKNIHSFNSQVHCYDIVSDEFELENGGSIDVKQDENGYFRLIINDIEIFSFESCSIVEKKVDENK